MHKGLKPAAQPRSLRAIAESKNGPDGFIGDPNFVYDSGIPASTPGAQGVYSDYANSATFGPTVGQMRGSAPFTNVRGGK